MTAKSTPINLEFYPPSYFWPMGVEKHLLSRIKGSKRKAALRELIDTGRLDDIPDLLARSALSEAERISIGRIHPAFMGGEYLPDIEAEEVEIARIEIDSTTSDVTSVYARRGESGIDYRVVDEYGGDTLSGCNECTSVRPLTLAQLEKFFLGAWPLIDVLQSNFERDIDGMLGFFHASSQFYLDLDELLRLRVRRCVANEQGDAGA
jgi:hypothetical protein